MTNDETHTQCPICSSYKTIIKADLVTSPHAYTIFCFGCHKHSVIHRKKEIEQ